MAKTAAQKQAFAKWYASKGQAHYAKYRKENPEVGRKAVKKYYKENQKTVAYREKRSKAIRKYGVPVEQYEEVYNALHNGECEICHRKAEDVKCAGRWRGLVIDHNHETNTFRGILCDTCNRAIGLMHDDVDVLKNAITYLEKP